MKLLLLVFAAALACCLALDEVEVREHFFKFMHRFDKTYETQEEFENRFAVFKKNLQKIDELNEKHPLATFGINEFSDLSQDEFQVKYKMPARKVTPPSDDSMFVHPPADATIPVSFDWRSKGAVTPVKNQEQCGSCWAFSTTEEIESQWFLAGNPLVSLAPQQIVDCDKTDAGCGGGDTPTAYEYVMNAGGMEPEADYPYTGQDGTCLAKSSKFAAKIIGWKYAAKNNNETEMAANLVTYGPLSICVDAESWQTYNGGIITSDCGNSLDHCVQVTGYGTSSAGVPYWNVRNSWGTAWGESGYIRVQRNKNLCGISDEATIAIVKGQTTTGGSGPSTSGSGGPISDFDLF